MGEIALFVVLESLHLYVFFLSESGELLRHGIRRLQRILKDILIGLLSSLDSTSAGFLEM